MIDYMNGMLEDFSMESKPTNTAPAPAAEDLIFLQLETVRFWTPKELTNFTHVLQPPRCVASNAGLRDFS